MRTYIFSAVATLTLGLLMLGPASAENAPWTCMSPAFACGGAPVAKSYRTQEFAGERKSRRQASSKRNRVAKKDDGVKRAARADKTADRKQAKVELPERKQVEAPAKPEAQAKPQTQGATEPAKDKTVAAARSRPRRAIGRPRRRRARRPTTATAPVRRRPRARASTPTP